MFRFNFEVSDNQIQNSSTEITKTVTSSVSKSNIINFECHCEEIQFDKDKLNSLSAYRQNCKKLTRNGFTINYITFLNLENLQKVSAANNITKANHSHSDLIPGLYEGGAKVWECTEDLLQYLLENCNVNYFGKKSVLDLGCGVGLLGIFALKREANKVWFQDYNKDVLENITIPNVLLNMKANEIVEYENVFNQCKFYSGDWEIFAKFTCSIQKFDFIFTSETIYNPENYEKLLNTFDNNLKEDGTIFLAAKIYYFGVGGGLRQFEELIKTDGRFQSQTIWNSQNGVAREILKIQRNL